MSILDRPYVGTWALNNRGVVRVTPDALVYLNGNLEVAGCPTCNGRIDIQKYVSAVSVDCGVETGSGSASISLHVPRQASFALFRDGQLLLRPGLEVNVYMRGYFPVQGILGATPPAETGGVDVSNAVMYPYYHVFHGVVIETSYEYAGGEHTATLTCKDMLHFWSYQFMSTSGSAFGARPHNSGIKFSLIGHTFTAMTPYSIIYTLYRDVMGAAGGIGFALGSKTNADAKTETGVEMWSYALLYWEQRFSQNFNQLRLYGTDGTLYNAYQQAFIGRLSTEETATLAKTFNDPATRSVDYDPMSKKLANTARLVGYDVASTYVGAQAEDDAAEGGLGININQMQAFLTDISAFGQVNLWESVYESKMDIVQAVTRLTGYEFYQDVDGDFVFKPPFYNLDTSSSRTYVLRDIDIISINFSESEPKVTALKVTSGHFGNITGLGLENNEWGSRSSYIDYRLVAQFGWRQDTFECGYLTDPKAMLYACAARMDLFNLEMHRANRQIPIRPELRPGMPVYVEPFDCFFYLQSFSHSLSFGGQCTTNLTLVGRRAKFFAPGIAPRDGSKATVDNIKLTDPWLPPLPIEIVGNDGISRLQGFPNVVMAIDTELLNPNFLSVGLNLIDTEEGIQALIRKAKDFGVLDFDPDLTAGKSERQKFLEGPFVLRTGADTVKQIPSPADLLAQAKSYQAAYNAAHPSAEKDAKTKQLGVLTDRDLAEQHAADLQAIIDRVLALRGTAIEDGDQTANYLDALSDLKASFSPGSSVPGYYRYYSSSHPDVNQQGMKDVVADAATTGTTQAAGLILLESPTTVLGFRRGTNLMETVDVTAGLPVMRPNTGNPARAVPTPTHQIATLSFAQIRLTKDIAVPQTQSSRQNGYPKQKLLDVMAPQLREKGNFFDDGSTTAQRFTDLYTTYADAANTVFGTIGLVNRSKISVPSLNSAIASAPRATKKGFVGKPVDPNLALGAQFNSPTKAVEMLSAHLAGQIASPVVAAFQQRFKELKEAVGAPGKPRASAQENVDAYANLDKAWSDFVFSLVPQDQVGASQGTKHDGLTVQVPAFNDKMVEYTPVFPVSDERGYEVVGAYAYGRGLSIEPGGNFETLQNTSPFANVSVDAVESFLEVLRNETSPSKALGVLIASDLEAAADLAVAAESVTGQLGEEILIEALTAGKAPTQFDNAFKAFVSSSRDASQKLTVTNAAFGLADLGLQSTQQICECKGAEADVLLMAFGQEEFLAVDQPDEVSAWLADRYAAATGPWQQSQNALIGQTVDSRTSSIAEAFRQAKGVFRSGVAEAAGAITQGGADLAAAGQAINQQTATLKEDATTLKDDVGAIIDFLNPNPDEG